MYTTEGFSLHADFRPPVLSDVDLNQKEIGIALPFIDVMSYRRPKEILLFLIVLHFRLLLFFLLLLPISLPFLFNQLRP